MRTDADGNLLCQKTLGGRSDEAAQSVVEASGGGFVMAGCTGCSTAADVYVVRTDAETNCIVSGLVNPVVAMVAALALKGMTVVRRRKILAKNS